MNVSEQIVNALLESPGPNSVCVSCQKEFKVQQGPNDSHGYCKRHYLEMYQDMIDTVMERNPGRIPHYMRSMEEIRRRPDNAFPPDLSQQQQQRAAVAQ